MAGAPPQLPGIFHTLAPVLDHYGYLAVAGFVLVDGKLHYPKGEKETTEAYH